MADFWIERAKQEKEDAERRVKNAYQRIPPEYHDFIIILRQSVKLGEPGSDFRITNEMRSLGMWYKDGALYVTIKVPYMAVDGRVQWARDDHRKAGKKLNFHPPVIDKGLVSVTIESEMLGCATGTAKIGSGGGVDKTNPVENAETSAVGRALGFLGYGLIGTGVASVEEILSAEKEKTADSGVANTGDAGLANGNKQNGNGNGNGNGVKEPGAALPQNQPRWIKGTINDYNLGRVKDKNYIFIQLSSGEKVVAPANYPFKMDLDEAKALGLQLEFNTVRQGNYEVIAGTTGNEVRLAESESIEDEIPF